MSPMYDKVTYGTNVQNVPVIYLLSVPTGGGDTPVILIICRNMGDDGGLILMCYSHLL